MTFTKHSLFGRKSNDHSVVETEDPYGRGTWHVRHGTPYVYY